jgi:hypothetical protein
MHGMSSRAHERQSLVLGSASPGQMSSFKALPCNPCYRLKRSARCSGASLCDGQSRGLVMDVLQRGENLPVHPIATSPMTVLISTTLFAIQHKDRQREIKRDATGSTEKAEESPASPKVPDLLTAISSLRWFVFELPSVSLAFLHTVIRRQGGLDTALHTVVIFADNRSRLSSVVRSTPPLQSRPKRPR